MNIELLIKDQKLLSPLKTYFEQKGEIPSSHPSLQAYFDESSHKQVDLFIIQIDFERETTLLDFIRDIRIYYGTYPVVIIVGYKDKISSIANFLSIGADNVFTYQFDLGAIEDYLSKNLNQNSFLPIHYRNLPSGGTPINFYRNINLVEINQFGIIFSSEDIISRGTFLNLDLESIINDNLPLIEFKVVSSDSSNGDDFSYNAEFVDPSSDSVKRIMHFLKIK